MKKVILSLGIIATLASPTLFGLMNRLNQDNWQERQQQAFNDRGLRPASGNAAFLAPMDGAHGSSSSSSIGVNLDNKKTDMNKTDLYQFSIGLVTTGLLGITAFATTDLSGWTNTKIPGIAITGLVGGASYCLNKSIAQEGRPSHYNKAGMLVGALGFLSLFAVKESALHRW